MSSKNFVSMQVNDKTSINIYPKGNFNAEEPVVYIKIQHEDRSTESVALRLSTFNKINAFVNGKLETVELLFKQE